MSKRAAYLYRLVVTLPEGADEVGWKPENWEEVCEARGWIDMERETGAEFTIPFSWPRRRLYMSAAAAEERAKMLREYGATVKIERSNPVTWPNASVTVWPSQEPPPRVVPVIVERPVC